MKLNNLMPKTEKLLPKLFSLFPHFALEATDRHSHLRVRVDIYGNVQSHTSLWPEYFGINLLHSLNRNLNTQRNGITFVRSERNTERSVQWHASWIAYISSLCMQWAWDSDEQMQGIDKKHDLNKRMLCKVNLLAIIG